MGRGFASPSLVNDITRPVSRPAKSGSRLPLTKYLKSNRKAKPSVRVERETTGLAEEDLRASEIFPYLAIESMIQGSPEMSLDLIGLRNLWRLLTSLVYKTAS